MTDAETVLWQGAPHLWPNRLFWITMFALSLGLAWVLVVASLQAGLCVAFLSDQDCRHPGFRSGKLMHFVMLALAVTASLTVKTFVGLPHERYSIAQTEIIRSSTWPFHSKRTQPLVHPSVANCGNCLAVKGAGEKPIRMGPLAKGQPEEILELIARLKAVKET